MSFENLLLNILYVHNEYLAMVNICFSNYNLILDPMSEFHYIHEVNIPLQLEMYTNFIKEFKIIQRNN